MTTVAELARLSENKLHDSGKNVSQAFWCEEKDIEKMELLQGDHVRLKTKGEGPLIGENHDNFPLSGILFLGSFSAEMCIFFYIATFFAPSGLEAALSVLFSCVH